MKSNLAGKPAMSFVELNQLTIDSMLKDLPLYSREVDHSASGEKVFNILEAQQELPGVLVTKKGKLIGVVSRQSFFEKTGKMFGTEIFLVRPVFIMLRMLHQKPLILPENTLITIATRKALERERDTINEPIVVEQMTGQYALIAAPMLFMAQSYQLMALHNQRQFTIEAGLKLSEAEAAARFLAFARVSRDYPYQTCFNRHSIRCDHCGQLVNYSVTDVVRSFPQLNRGIVIEESMGLRSYTLYVRHHCGIEIWEIPVIHDEDLEYRSQRPARAVDTHV